MQDSSKQMIIAFLIITTLIILLLLGFIISILFLYKKKQLEFILELERIKINFEKELLKTELEIKEDAFQYMSQEIHDNIGQFITLAKLHINTLDFGDPEIAGQQVIYATDLLTTALDDLRDLSRSMSSEIIKKSGLTGAVSLHVTQLKRLESPKVMYKLLGDYKFLNEQKEIFILRILQEGINNIVRHSEANLIEIVLTYFDDALSLLIRDNGKGFDVDSVHPKRTSGINNMRKRALMIGSKFEIHSVPNQGTSILLTIPY